MTEREQDDADPTAEFLAEVRPGETPWRIDRPAGEDVAGAADQPAGRPQNGRPEKWRRTKAAGRVAGQVAPYVQAAAVVGWIAGSAFGDGGGGGDGGQSG